MALYPATSESEKISFNQLNRATGHRIKYLKVDADTGQEVANEDIVEGFKVDMLDLARHIVNKKSGRFEPDKFETCTKPPSSISSTRSAPASRSRRRRGRPPAMSST